ncbi:MAG: alpha/beta fold hydrolase [Alphaproteobacteria bacterium]
MVDAVNGLESRFIKAAGVNVHYQETGSGQPVICIHGAGPGADSASNFRRNVDALSRHFRVVLYDMPQFGKSDKVVVDEGRLAFNARVLADFMAGMGIAKAHIIGNSMGGQVALKLAIDHPERVGRLVVIGSGAVNRSLFTPLPVEGVKMISDYYKGEGPTREKLRRLLETIVYDPSFLTEEVFEQRYQASVEPETRKLFVERQGPYRKEDLAPDLPGIKSETLVVWGLDDRFGALDVGLQITRLMPNAQMHIFSRCGHWAQVEHAEAFNRLVIGFLGG